MIFTRTYSRPDVLPFALHTLSHLVFRNPNNERQISLLCFKDEKMEAQGGELRGWGELDFCFDLSYLYAHFHYLKLPAICYTIEDSGLGSCKFWRLNVQLVTASHYVIGIGNKTLRNRNYRELVKKLCCSHTVESMNLKWNQGNPLYVIWSNHKCFIKWKKQSAECLLCFLVRNIIIHIM